jgi:hypothetical protein
MQLLCSTLITPDVCLLYRQKQQWHICLVTRFFFTFVSMNFWAQFSQALNASSAVQVAIILFLSECVYSNHADIFLSVLRCEYCASLHSKI